MFSTKKSSFPDDDFLVENVWISTFYQTFRLFNHILSILATIMAILPLIIVQ